jgi:hypothetical protein
VILLPHLHAILLQLAHAICFTASPLCDLF